MYLKNGWIYFFFSVDPLFLIVFKQYTRYKIYDAT